MNTLVAFVSPHDPFVFGAVETVQKLGPVLARLQAQPADRLVLVSTAALLGAATRTAEIVAARLPKTVIDFDQVQPTARLSDSLSAIRDLVARLRQRFPDATLEILPGGAPAPVATALLLLGAAGDLGAAVIPSGEAFGEAAETIAPLAGAADALRSSFAVAEPEAMFADDVFRAHGCLGSHPRYRKALSAVESLAPQSLPLLIAGEPGAGQEQLAKAAHQLSMRTGPFLEASLSALPEVALDATLFGVARSNQRVPGLLEKADQGTVFLTDIERLSDRSQQRLLRLLNEGELEVAGAARPLPLKVRLIVGTTRDLAPEVAAGHLREDLFAKINTADIALPPLRERRQDIPMIVDALLDELNKLLASPRQLSRDALAYLQRQPWPGNLRDLRRTLERAVLFARDTTIQIGDLTLDEETPPTVSADGDLPALFVGFSMEDYLGNLRKQIIFKALDQAGGNQSEASRLLGISPQAVNKFLKVMQEEAMMAAMQNAAPSA